MSNHNIFQRNFDHVSGNWPSFIFVKVPLAHVQKAISFGNKQFQDKHSGYIDIIINETHPHISLSRPFTLKQHQISAFVKNLHKNLKLIDPFVIDASPSMFTLMNDSKTRGFICLPVCLGLEKFQNIIKIIDTELKAFHKSSYYEDLKLHISIGSFRIWEQYESYWKDFESNNSLQPINFLSENDDISDEEEFDDYNINARKFIRVIIDEENEIDDKIDASTPFSATTTTCCARFQIQEISCKFGNIIYEINLRDKTCKSMI